AYVAGVLNLRGSVVTVMDFRQKFGMGETSITEDSAIIIVEANYDDEMAVIGALVDAVKGVLMFEKDQIEPPPKVGMKLSADFINGIGKKEDEFVVILNVDRVFSEDDLLIARENLEPAEIPQEGIIQEEAATAG
ncbi:MAG TPA: chemotaxis protein CheW, partial [Spirochaetota bacterium]|nr:chemotaxis protein CheW [Spirochaetota bacterium]